MVIATPTSIYLSLHAAILSNYVEGLSYNPVAIFLMYSLVFQIWWKIIQSFLWYSFGVVVTIQFSWKAYIQ